MSSGALEPVFHNKRSHRGETVSPARRYQKKAHTATKTQHIRKLSN